MTTTREEQALELIRACVAEVEAQRMPWNVKVTELAATQAILDAEPELHVAVIREALDQEKMKTLTAQPASRSTWWHGVRTAGDLVVLLCKRTLPYTCDDVRAILQGLAKKNYPVQALLRALARPLVDPEILAACYPQLEQLRTASMSWYQSADTRKFQNLLDDLLGGQRDREFTLADDGWGDQVRPLLNQLDPATRETWQTLLLHCAAASGSAPSVRWLTQTQRLVSALGPVLFAQHASEWLGAFRISSNKPPEIDPRSGARLSLGCLLVEENAALLRGLAWACSTSDDARLAAVLADGAIAGYRKITNVGPRSAKVASACVLALKSMPGLNGIAQLERVRLGVKQPTYVKGIEKALDEAARRIGMTREDLEELTVPTFDLDRESRLRVSIAAAVAELAVVRLEVTLQWRDAAGTPRKAAPSDVRSGHKAELQELKRLHDDMSRMLLAQRERLERLLLTERTWPLATWRERYLDHPLVGPLARRLIWRFSEDNHVTDGCWLDGQLVNAEDCPLVLTKATTVSLWHPALHSPAEVLAWREWLERHQVTQPFKQAHREVYLLTDAERTTRVYSNRFAAHILRQHQFNALCAARGWRNKLRLMVDDSYPPATLELPRWGLRVEFWIEGAGDDYQVDTNETGTYLHIATDQVRFYAVDAATNSAHAGGGGYASDRFDWRTRHVRPESARDAPLALEQIPPLVFSEAMRDVDLFVGVASVGNDPTWQDGGPHGRYRDYWTSYSFGELSATAETRKQLLSRLVPRLAIAERCEIVGRFLRVRGDLRTYKIHLGSSNILMEPNDQYLCIVPGRGSTASLTEGLFLPFEGDSAFSIILSKAFLLADDKQITDPTITRQIGAA